MVYCIAQAAADSSWWTVDADTYRYFFSASAQVFAAIFAVVAIAYSFRISEIQRSSNDLRNKMIRMLQYVNITNLQLELNTMLSINCKEFSRAITDALASHTWEFDDEIIDAIIKVVVEDLVLLINEVGGSSNSLEDERIKMCLQKIGELEPLAHLKNSSESLRSERIVASRAIMISSALSASMIVLSLIILVFELFNYHVPIFALMLFIVTLGTITIVFISAFANLTNSKRSFRRNLFHRLSQHIRHRMDPNFMPNNMNPKKPTSARNRKL